MGEAHSQCEAVLNLAGYTTLTSAGPTCRLKGTGADYQFINEVSTDLLIEASTDGVELCWFGTLGSHQGSDTYRIVMLDYHQKRLPLPTYQRGYFLLHTGFYLTAWNKQWHMATVRCG